MTNYVFPVQGTVRRARWMANLSQREMARRMAVSPSTVGRVEAGSLMPSITLLTRLIGIAELRLVVVDNDGFVIHPLFGGELIEDEVGVIL